MQVIFSWIDLARRRLHKLYSAFAEEAEAEERSSAAAAAASRKLKGSWF